MYNINIILYELLVKHPRIFDISSIHRIFVSGLTFGYIQTTSFMVAFPEHKDCCVGLLDSTIHMTVGECWPRAALGWRFVNWLNRSVPVHEARACEGVR